MVDGTIAGIAGLSVALSIALPAISGVRVPGAAPELLAVAALVVVVVIGARALARPAVPRPGAVERRRGRPPRCPMTRSRERLLAAAAAVPMAGYWLRREEPLGWTLLAMGMVACALVVMRQLSVIEELAEHRNHLDHLAHHDVVSGLPNRVMFERRLREAGLTGRPVEVAVLYVDLDNFKQINDRYGHEMGDLVLREVGVRLGGLVRADDVVARVGGDEFAVLLVDERIEDAAQSMAVRILARLSAPLSLPELGADRVEIRASIGVFAPAVELDRALSIADGAMYRAKHGGKGRIARASAGGAPGIDGVGAGEPGRSETAGVGPQPAGERADIEVSGHAERDEGDREADPQPSGD